MLQQVNRSLAGSNAPEIIEVLIEAALQSPEWEIRADAAAVLGNHGFESCRGSVVSYFKEGPKQDCP